jgi:hypothetical protein
LAAGYHLVTLHPTEEFSAYLDIMQPSAGLAEDEATDLALQAASNDLLPGIRPRSGHVCRTLLHHRPRNRDAAPAQRDGHHLTVA